MLRNFDRLAERGDSIESEHLKILSYDLAKGYEGTYKTYNSYRLCTILTGRKNVSINGGNTFHYTDSEYILLPPSSSVRMSISAHTKAIVYEISDHIIQPISEKMECKLQNCSDNIGKKSYSPKLFNSIRNLNLDMYQHDKESKFIMDLHAQELVYRLLDNNASPNSSTTHQVNYSPAYAAKDIISKPGNEHLSIGEVANILNISHANLDYYFKKSYNLSPKKYQTQIKIERSVELLQHENVTEVAMRLGFDNISHFIRLFKAKYGTTPKQYMK